MNTQQEQLSTQIQSVFEAQMWFAGVTSLLGVVSFILVLAAIIVIYKKTKAPGSLLMLIGISMTAIFMLTSMFMVIDLRHMDANQSKIFWASQLAGYFFIFLTSLGFIRFALIFNRKNES